MFPTTFTSMWFEIDIGRVSEPAARGEGRLAFSATA
jgi:hypothetical protein